MGLGRLQSVVRRSLGAGTSMRDSPGIVHKLSCHPAAFPVLASGTPSWGCMSVAVMIV
jgi:hypothetical protein